jgi:hypothetical protein
LRVFSALLAPFSLFFGTLTGRTNWVRGGRASSVVNSLLVVRIPLVEYGSRVQELVEWFQHSLGLLFLATMLWWQESSPAMENLLGISANKFVFKSLSSLMITHIAGVSSWLFFVGPPSGGIRRELVG